MPRRFAHFAGPARAPNKVLVLHEIIHLFALRARERARKKRMGPALRKQPGPVANPVITGVDNEEP